jgi:hypothetical protein
VPRVSEAYGSQAGHYDRRTDAFRQWRELLRPFIIDFTGFDQHPLMGPFRGMRAG